VDYSPQTKYNETSGYFSMSFYTDSYVSRWGANIGGDLLLFDAQGTEPAGSLLIPFVGASYRTVLLPDVLFLIPEFNAGYAFKTDTFVTQSAMVSPKLSVGVRIKFIELMAGVNYRYFISEFKDQNGAYPVAGVRLNLNKNN
jgi:hypothetical protein